MPHFGGRPAVDGMLPAGLPSLGFEIAAHDLQRFSRELLLILGFPELFEIVVPGECVNRILLAPRAHRENAATLLFATLVDRNCLQPAAKTRAALIVLKPRQLLEKNDE